MERCLTRDTAVQTAPASRLQGVLPKWHGPFQARFTHSVIPSEVEESLILTVTSSKRCLDCARHDKKTIWATGPTHPTPSSLFVLAESFNVIQFGRPPGRRTRLAIRRT